MTTIGLEKLLALETAVWRALVDGDAEADAALLHDDFLGVYPSGFADRDDHRGQLADGPSIATFELSEPRAVTISDDAALLSYRASFRRVSGPDDAPVEAMYVSSLWWRRNGRWTNVFSQDTPVG